MSTKVFVNINKTVPPPPNAMVPVHVNKNLKWNTINIAETTKSRNETKSTTLTQKTETLKLSLYMYLPTIMEPLLIVLHSVVYHNQTSKWTQEQNRVLCDRKVFLKTFLGLYWKYEKLLFFFILNTQSLIEPCKSQIVHSTWHVNALLWNLVCMLTLL